MVEIVDTTHTDKKKNKKQKNKLKMKYDTTKAITLGMYITSHIQRKCAQTRKTNEN